MENLRRLRDQWNCVTETYTSMQFGDQCACVLVVLYLVESLLPANEGARDVKCAIML